MKTLTHTVVTLRQGLTVITIALVMTFFSVGTAASQDKNQIVRIARLQIDPARLDVYNTALKEEIETSVRIEPGVLNLFAVADKDSPSHITILEIYASSDAYKAHLETSHFKKYKSTTKEMVKSLELVETIPIMLGAKRK